MSSRSCLLPDKLDPSVCEGREKSFSTLINNNAKFCDICHTGVESTSRYFRFKLEIYVVELHVLHPLNEMIKIQSFANCYRINLIKRQHFS